MNQLPIKALTRSGLFAIENYEKKADQTGRLIDSSSPWQISLKYILQNENEKVKRLGYGIYMSILLIGWFFDVIRFNIIWTAPATSTQKEEKVIISYSFEKKKKGKMWHISLVFLPWMFDARGFYRPDCFARRPYSWNKYYFWWRWQSAELGY